MSLEQVHADLESYIEAADLNGIALTFDNVEASSFFLASDKFVAFSVEFLRATRLEINPNPNTREEGVLTYNIHLPKGTGAREAYKFLDQMDAAILHKTRAGVYFQERRKIGEYKIGKWQVYTYQYAFMFCG